MRLEGAARQNSHPVIARDFYHWPADVRSRDDARFCVTLPLAPCGMAVQAGSDDPTVANLAGRVRGERCEQRQLVGESGGKRKET